MAQQPFFEWDAKESEREPKSADWYWALGIVAAAAIIACILFANYLLAIVIIAATAAVTIHAAKDPKTHHFAVTDEGIVIGQELHRFAHMRSFAVLEYVDQDRDPVLSIKTENWLAPHLLIPLENVDDDALYAFLLSHIEEGEHRHTVSDVVGAWMGL